MELGKAQVFTFELSQIKDEKIKEFTIRALNELPNYFYQIPASSTGKYHPSQSLGEGGLVRHVKSAIGIALELFRCKSCYFFTDEEQDIIISALLLHDGMKGSPHTMFTHPLVVVEMIKRTESVIKNVNMTVLDKIINAIKSHMGSWCTSKYSEVVLPTPQTEIEKFVHLCDFISSRKSLERGFIDG